MPEDKVSYRKKTRGTYTARHLNMVMDCILYSAFLAIGHPKCFTMCTDWHMFREAATIDGFIDLEEYTASVTGYQ